MKVENNCLITKFATYPLDRIELVNTVFEDNGNGYTFRIKAPDDIMLSAGRESVEEDGIYILVPIESETEVIAVYQTIKEYKGGFLEIDIEEMPLFELTAKGKLVLEIDKALGHDAAIAMLEGMQLDQVNESRKS